MPKDAVRTERVEFRCAQAQLEYWKAAAAVSGLHFSAWIRQALKDSAEMEFWNEENGETEVPGSPFLADRCGTPLGAGVNAQEEA